MEFRCFNHPVFRIEPIRLDPEDLLRIFLVADDHIASGHEGGHDLRGRLAIFPKILSVVEVTGDFNAVSVRRLDRLKADIRTTLADRRGYSCPVEPIRILEHLVPVDHSRLDLRDGRVRAVVDHFAWPGHRPFLDVVDADPVPALDAEFHSDT